MEWISDKKGNFVCGNYVMTEVNNAFNNKKSFWISKAGCTSAFYCFTPLDDIDFHKQLKNPQVWIDYFEGRVIKKEALYAGYGTETDNRNYYELIAECTA